MSVHARDDEERLIARSQHGDVEAFNQLVLRYQQIMFGTVFRMLGDYDTASDVTQDAFIAAFRAIRSYRGGASFRAWLLRIGSNMACDHWRRVQRHPQASLEELTTENETQSSELLNTLISTGLDGNPEESLLSQELQGVIQQGIQGLPLEQRVILVLCDVQGFSYDEAALAAQVPVGTVRSRLSRARGRLRDHLQKHRELLPRDYRLTSNND